MRAWLLATKNDIHQEEFVICKGEHYSGLGIVAHKEVLTLLTGMSETTQVWLVSMNEYVKSGDWSVTADKVT